MKVLNKMFLWERKTVCKVSGVGIIELVLILAVLVALVLVFRNELSELVVSAFTRINADAERIVD